VNMNTKNTDLKKDGKPKGWDNLKFMMIKEGDAAVCAAPFAVPIEQKIEVKSLGDFNTLRELISQATRGEKVITSQNPILKSKSLKCKTGRIRYKTIKKPADLEDLGKHLKSGTIKEMKCKIKRRKVGGNFAKMNCWGEIEDFLGKGKDIKCKGHNIYGDWVNGWVGEIPSEDFRDVIHENVGKCKGWTLLGRQKRLIVPHNILEKGRALLNFCNEVILKIKDTGIPKDKNNNPKTNPLSPNEFRSLESQSC